MKFVREKHILDFSTGINPLGPPEWFRRVISANVSLLTRCPDRQCSALIEAIAKRYGAYPQDVILGNGSSEIIRMLPLALKPARAVIPVPSRLDYAIAASEAGVAIETLRLREDEGFTLEYDALDSILAGNEIVSLGQPNNPTGLLFDPYRLRGLASAHPSTVFIIDEALYYGRRDSDVGI